MRVLLIFLHGHYLFHAEKQMINAIGKAIRTSDFSHLLQIGKDLLLH